jgi:hypothetical protein
MRTIYLYWMGVYANCCYCLARFCPLIMRVGRPKKVDPGSLYTFAHQFYWHFRSLSEGRTRFLIDKNQYEQLARQATKANLQLDDEQKAHARQVVEKEIQDGRLHESERERRFRDIEDGQVWANRLDLLNDAAEKSTRTVRVPGEADVIESLLNPSTTPDQIRTLCKDALMTRTLEVQPGIYKEVEVPAWPIPAGSPLPTYLSKYAEQFVAALRDPRFPRCDASTRPSTRLKQLWFLSRALAGALFEVSTRTAINLVGSLRPEEIFKESRNAKPERKRTRQKYKLRRTSKLFEVKRACRLFEAADKP